MSSHYYYKGTDISTMITSGSNTISNYIGFPPYNTTNNTYDLVDVGFANAYQDNGQGFTNKRIQAISATMNTSGNISIPSWCNSVKILLSCNKGNKGAIGNKGNKGTIGNAGITKVSASVNCGPKSRGSCTANGGAGGEGGDGGDGGEGGEGGDGGYIYSNNIYVIPSSTTISTQMSGLSNNIIIKDNANNNNVFTVVTNTSNGPTGPTGNSGGSGSNGGDGNFSNGDCNGGIFGTEANAPQCTAGAKGAKGAKGVKGTKGIKGSKGATSSSISTYYESPATPVSFTSTGTGNTNYATVYFFRK